MRDAARYSRIPFTLEQSKRAAEKAFGPVASRLASGTFGDYWELEESGWGVKITGSRGEAVFASLVNRMQMDGVRGGQGFVVVEAIRRVHGFDGMAIKTEIVDPGFSDYDILRPLEEITTAAGALDRVYPASGVTSPQAGRPPKNDEDVTMAMESYLYAVSDLKRIVPAVYEAAVGMAERYGIGLHDLTRSNLGATIRNWGPQMRPPGTVVIMDLGQNSYELEL